MHILKRTTPWLVTLTLLIALLAQAQAGLAQGPQPRGPNVAQGNAISYQGQLKRDGSQYSGTCDFRFGLWDALNGGSQQGTTQSAAAVEVNNGLFGVSLDFGNQFKGEARWLETASSAPAMRAIPRLRRARRYVPCRMHCHLRLAP